MEVVIISKEKYEEMVGKLNLLSDRVNEIIGMRERGKLSRWMDNQDVCQQLRSALSGLWRTGARMPHGVAGQSDK